MELAEVARRKDADEQRAQAKGENVADRPRMENAHVRYQQISNRSVKESPNHVDCGRGQALAGWICN